MSIPLDNRQPKPLGVAYPILCYFLKLVALSLGQKTAVLVAKVGAFKPVVLSYGGISHRTLATIVQQLPHQDMELSATDSTNYQDGPLTLKSNIHSSWGHNQRPAPLLIGHIHSPQLKDGFVFAVPGLELNDLSADSRKVLKTLSHQLIYGLEMTRQFETFKHKTRGQRFNQTITNEEAAKKTTVILTCTTLLKTGPTLARPNVDDSARWVDLFSELQSCLSFKQLKQRLESYVPLLLPQHIARLVVLEGEAGQFSVVSQWGNAQDLADLVATCCTSKIAPCHLEDNFNICRQCAVANPQNPSFVCIVLGLFKQKAYVLQIFWAESTALSPTQVGLIQHLSKQLQAVMKRLQMVEDLQAQASQDPLTGLENRRYMQTMLDNLCHHFSPGFQTSVILIDIDHFKGVNDTYGHLAGDAVLKDLSVLLKGHVRAKDIVCRYGGEEFCMILLDTSIEVALKRAEKIRRAVKYLNVYFDGKPLESLSVSIGIAQFPIHGKTPEQLIEKADRALYWAKGHGRDQSITYDPVLHVQQTLTVPQSMRALPTTQPSERV